MFRITGTARSGRSEHRAEEYGRPGHSRWPHPVVFTRSQGISAFKQVESSPPGRFIVPGPRLVFFVSLVSAHISHGESLKPSSLHSATIALRSCWALPSNHLRSTLLVNSRLSSISISFPLSGPRCYPQRRRRSRTRYGA
jgi:hypothetical protein